MDISQFRLLFDTGLFVLIWIVQLIIYPSFLYYKNEDLDKWHKKYTVNISYIVIPLMIGQLAFAIYQLFETQTIITSIYFLLVVCNWISTFTIFVPLHSKIAMGNQEKNVLKKLVSYNWVRTILWTLIFIGSLFECVVHLS